MLPIHECGMLNDEHPVHRSAFGCFLSCAPCTLVGHVPTCRYTRRFLGGRQPLCGSGVTSSMALTVSPAACKAVIADSRPEPGPFTRTSISRTPNLVALSAHVSAAR